MQHFCNEDLFDLRAESLLESESLTNRTLIHIRIQQRTANKKITTIQNIDKISTIDLDYFLRTVRKYCDCGGSIIKHKQFGLVIQLQGDQREKIKTYLKNNNLVPMNDIIIHGY